MVRTPKPLFSSDFEMMAKKKADLIDMKRSEREKKFQRPVSQTLNSKADMDSSKMRDSSMDRSSDSHKQVILGL